jgi:hypothetical protein
MKYTTPIPNVVIDVYFPLMSRTERDIIQVIFRQTLGWIDDNTRTGRKESDWISHSQFKSKTGWSRRMIVTAVQKLVERKLIDILDASGNLINAPEQRRGRQRLYYRPALWWINGGKHVHNPVESDSTCAIDALGLREEYASLVHGMRATNN